MIRSRIIKFVKAYHVEWWFSRPK